MARRRISVWLFCSLGLHIFLAIGFAILQTSAPSNPSPSPTVEIEVRERVIARPKGGGARGASRLSLKSLVPTLPMRIPSDSDLSAGMGGRGAGDLQLGWGEGGGDFARIADNLFFDNIREQIEGLLYYPPVLARNNISGVIKSRLVLTGRGECDFARTSVSGSQPYLKNYTLSVLKKLCAIDLKRGLPQKDWIVMDLAFDFDLNHDPYGADYKNITVGNVLLFHRAASSVAEWKLGPFKGYWFAPVINLDFQWFADKWDKDVKGRDLYEDFKGG